MFCALILANLAACGNDAPVDTTAADTTPAVTTDAYADDLPDSLNFGGETVTFLYRAEIANEFYVEEATGDVVDDALRASIRSVEERLNVDIVAELMDGHMAAARTPYMNHITNTIMAGDDLYDWVDLMIGNSPMLMRTGIFKNLLTNPYIDLDKPWYLSDLAESIAIDNKLYFIAGDISLGYIKDAFGIYFNTTVAENFKLESLYKLVDDGKWTLDKMMEISSIASQDVNGDTKYDENDKLGFLVHNYNHLNGFVMSTDLNVYQTTDDGLPEFTFGSDRDVSVCEKLYKALYNTPGSFDCNLSDTTASEVGAFNHLTNMFASDQILMMTAELDEAVVYLRDMKSPYGILPFPKYDEVQKEYISTSRNTHNAFSMPITCADPDMAGAVMEALSASNHTSLLPAYFEVALKTKYSRDDDSARMFDLIRSTMVLDFGYTYNNALGFPITEVVWKSFKEENSISSNVASSISSLDANLEKLLTDIRENCLN
ncbi:MAG: hypothetical protein E7632_01035 [Ruminococcaceae bacterium]|nr:hypothetical protein [Oscillospiraceae bacterium]